jgi:hypothetical protein
VLLGWENGRTTTSRHVAEPRTLRDLADINFQKKPSPTVQGLA